MFAIRGKKKNDFQKLLGGNHICNIEVARMKRDDVGLVVTISAPEPEGHSNMVLSHHHRCYLSLPSTESG